MYLRLRRRRVGHRWTPFHCIKLRGENPVPSTTRRCYPIGAINDRPPWHRFLLGLEGASRFSARKSYIEGWWVGIDKISFSFLVSWRVTDCHSKPYGCLAMTHSCPNSTSKPSCPIFCLNFRFSFSFASFLISFPAGKEKEKKICYNIKNEILEVYPCACS